MPRRRLTLMRINRSADLPMFAVADRPFDQDIRTALDPQITVERYGRSWRLSRPRTIEDQPLLWGKLGYHGASSGSDVEYDEESEDFVTVSGRQHGQFSYYVLDLEDRYLLFEERPPDIKRQSFSGALHAILHESMSPYIFDVDPVVDPEDFIAWLRRTHRVTRFRATVRQPNPNWDGRPQNIRDLIEESNAARVAVEATAATDGPGLKIMESDLRPFVEHISEGNGVISSAGETEQGPTVFHSERKVRGTNLDIDISEPEESFVQRLFNILRSLKP